MFHVFHKDDVVNFIQSDITPLNSKARHKKQTDDQKVVFKSQFHNRQVGEIEDLHDSLLHFRQMKFRLNGPSITEILIHNVSDPVELNNQVLLYGNAIKKFKM